MVVDVTGDNNGNNSRIISPVTMDSTTSIASVTTRNSAVSQSTERSRRSPKQASAHRLKTKQIKLDYDVRYNTAFKNATNLVASKAGESVGTIWKRLDVIQRYDLWTSRFALVERPDVSVKCQIFLFSKWIRWFFLREGVCKILIVGPKLLYVYRLSLTSALYGSRLSTGYYYSRWTTRCY